MEKHVILIWKYDLFSDLISIRSFRNPGRLLFFGACALLLLSVSSCATIRVNKFIKSQEYEVLPENLENYRLVLDGFGNVISQDDLTGVESRIPDIIGPFLCNPCGGQRCPCPCPKGDFNCLPFGGKILNDMIFTADKIMLLKKSLEGQILESKNVTKKFVIPIDRGSDIQHEIELTLDGKKHVQTIPPLP